MIGGARLWRRLGLALAGVLALVLILFATLLAMADRGAFDDRIAGWVSARLGRTVQMRKVRVHLLSKNPMIVVRGLVIANPGWMHGGNLAEVERLAARIELWPLLRGTLRARAISVSGAHLHLVRYAPGRNNWSLTDHPKPGPAFAPLASVTRFSVDRSTVEMHDFGRDLVLSGPFRHEPDGSKPFRFEGKGMLEGFPVTLAGAGGQLNGPGVGPAWPFRVTMTDADTVVMAQGVSAQPFDLSRYDLGMAAHGPNLADLGYLFNFNMPNSAVYRIAARARSDGAHFGFANIHGKVGESDVAGWLRSDHSGKRRRVIASFHSGLLARSDIDALLAPIPPRAQARKASGGVVSSVSTGRWILPDATFGMARLRATDFEFEVKADRTSGYALPLRDLSTRIIAANGLLRFTGFRSSLYSGRVEGSGSLDARQDVPRLAVRGRARGLRLAEIGPALGQPPQAALGMDVDLSGVGDSVHAAAGHATGTVSGRLTDAVMPRRAGWILGGDLLRAATNAGGRNAPATVAIACAAGSLRGEGGGLFAVTSLGIRTALGLARGAGSIDLGQERLSILLQGQADKKRLLQIKAPIRIEGPMLAPRLSVLPGGKARALGLKGTLGVALTPVAGLLPIKGKPAAPLAPDAGC